ncbi:SDR family oxidoreductase [Patulibacter sp. NPDC049589]|uniref:SDR family oxidoreductase n=1 Tax=Patulibacter sp. NPDC049589 TaxID=3154731 RepID=UPI0034438679
MTFEDQRIVLLGGTSGIGLATAELAAEQGAHVVVASSSAARVEAALQRLPGTAEGRVVDLTDEAATRAALDAIGRHDHLVYTAGEELVLSLVDDTPVDVARRALDLRVWGAYAAVKHAHRLLRPGGSIVLTTGIAGARPQAGWTVGATVCAAVEGLTGALAVELAPLRVNAVSPGIVRTDLWRGMDPADREALYATTADALPAGRVGEAEDIARTILHLVGSGFTTGTVVTVDGGALLV